MLLPPVLGEDVGELELIRDSALPVVEGEGRQEEKPLALSKNGIKVLERRCHTCLLYGAFGRQAAAVRGECLSRGSMARVCQSELLKKAVPRIA